ncbi:MAG TPA: CRTAC1 family protein [Thermoanaerobaculia bacterium]|nr:CRTAC1 family protein [Thermoanaerobaculia bacterium]
MTTTDPRRPTAVDSDEAADDPLPPETGGLGAGPGGRIDPDDLVPEDDAIIGRALRWSAVLVLGIGLLVALGVFLARRPEAAPPVQAIEAAAPEAVTRSLDPPAVRFTDVTAESGIDFVHTTGAYGDKLLPETMGGGVAAFDFDNDGDQDLLFVNSSTWPFAAASRASGGSAPSSHLYENDGQGRFRDVSAATGIADATRSFYGMGVAAADVDGDGWTDLFLTAVGENRLLRNREGRFEDVTDDAGVAGSPDEWSTGAAFFDIDNDGDLDLFVANYVRWSKEIDFEVDFRLTGVGRAYGPPQSYQGTFPYLYRNDGDGTFTDVSESAGVQITNEATGVPMAKALALAPIDVDRDGFIDLLVANDTVRNLFFHNQRDGTFSEEGEYYGLAYDRDGNATGAMGVDVGYLRDDGNLAFLIGNFANEMTSVYVAQDDPGLYVDEAIGEGIGAPSRLALSFGLYLFDYDLDGRLDVLQTNGHLEEEINQVDPSQHYRQPAQLFWNAGDAAPRRFALVEPETAGDLAKPIVGRGSTYADFDGDGDLDVVITQVGDAPLLLRNEQDLGHHWLRVRLVDRPPNRGAVGAWVTLTASGITQRRQVMPTKSYLSQVELPLTFGLGDATAVDSLEITWPDGETEVIGEVGLDRLLVVDRTAPSPPTSQR